MRNISSIHNQNINIPHSAVPHHPINNVNNNINIMNNNPNPNMNEMNQNGGIYKGNENIHQANSYQPFTQSPQRIDYNYSYDSPHNNFSYNPYGSPSHN